MTNAPEYIVDLIEDIFERRGAESYLGEEVTMAQHMLQAAQCAEEAGADNSQIVAALLHDIGHYKNEIPESSLSKGINNFHEEAGANFLEDYFPLSVVEPVRQHVATKRYLCAVDSNYFSLLSSASVDTLDLQGGAMSLKEVKEFECNDKPPTPDRDWFAEVGESETFELRIKEDKEFECNDNLTICH
mgnify:CR=1 FL=1